MDNEHFILVFLLEEVPCTNLIETDHIDNNTFEVLDRSTSSNRIYNRKLMFETILPQTSEILQYSACGEANEYTHVKICNLCFFS